MPTAQLLVTTSTLRTAILGNAQMFLDQKIPLGDLPKQAEAFRRDGNTVVFIAVDGSAAGLIAVADPVKASASGSYRVVT